MGVCDEGSHGDQGREGPRGKVLVVGPNTLGWRREISVESFLAQRKANFAVDVGDSEPVGGNPVSLPVHSTRDVRAKGKRT